jgi:hypothetical protein
MNRLRQFATDRSGHFSLLVGILSIPLIASAGIALDYAQASRIRSLLNGAADAAAIGAVSRSSPTYKNGGGFDEDWTKQDAEQDALNLFKAYIIDKSGFEIGELEADISLQGADIVSKVSFTAEVPLTFMRVLGHNTMTIDGEARAEIRTAPYMDFYMLLDNSPSMGVAATPSDIATMVGNTPDQCAFACHDLSKSNNYYNLAKTLNVTMRIDVVREATQQLFTKAEEVRVHANQFRMGLYTFGDAATSLGLKQLTGPTSNMTKAKTAANKVDLMTIPYQNYDNDQQTNFDDTFDDLNDKITSVGTGSSPSDRQKIVFFVSDGVGDSYKPGSCTKPTHNGRCQEPIDVSVCEALKARGITIAALYTTYLPLPTNGWYNQWIAPFSSEIGTKMSQCATPGFYFEVSPTEGIAEAMEALFLKVIASPRITS